METKTDQCYGVIPIHALPDGSWEVFLIHQKSHRGDIYWTFPKGHAEAGESPEVTALRELKEETELTAELDTSKTFEQKYSFEHKGVVIDKVVTYFLGAVAETESVLQTEEVAEAKWCSPEEAHELLTHGISKEMFRSVIESLA